jgi:hypothetical protein
MIRSQLTPQGFAAGEFGSDGPLRDYAVQQDKKTGAGSAVPLRDKSARIRAFLKYLEDIRAQTD